MIRDFHFLPRTRTFTLTAGAPRRHLPDFSAAHAPLPTPTPALTLTPGHISKLMSPARTEEEGNISFLLLWYNLPQRMMEVDKLVKTQPIHSILRPLVGYENIENQMRRKTGVVSPELFDSRKKMLSGEYE